MKKEKINAIADKNNISMTPLRTDILSILLASKRPIGAYDILDKLRKNRPNAEPPTVYRVLEFFIENHIIHKIETSNTYFLCTTAGDKNLKHNALLMVCNTCKKAFEFEDKALQKNIEQFSKKHHIKIDHELIVTSGLCKTCLRD